MAIVGARDDLDDGKHGACFLVRQSEKLAPRLESARGKERVDNTFGSERVVDGDLRSDPKARGRPGSVARLREAVRRVRAP